MDGRKERRRPGGALPAWHLVAIAGTVLGFLALDRAGFLADVPVWVLLALIGVGAGIRPLTHALWPAGAPVGALHARVALQTAFAGAVVYATGWGPALALGFVLIAADNIHVSGSSAARPAVVWAGVAVAGGQVAVAAGAAPSMLPVPEGHGLAALALMGVAFAAHRMGAATAETERATAALAASERRFRSLVQNASDVIVAVDATGDIAYASPSFERLLGYEAQAVADLDAAALVHPEDWPAAQALYGAAVAAPGAPQTAELRVRRRDGVWRWFDVRITNVLGEPNVACLVANLTDIDDRRAAADALRRAYEREHEAAEELRKLDDIKNAFLHAVSHELRTPATVLLGHAQTLRHQRARLRADEVEDLVGGIAANARKLERLLTELLDLDRLSRGIIEPKRRATDVAEIARRVADDLDASGHDVWVAPGPVLAHVDPAQAERILENLVVNALRHTPPGTRVWVSVARIPDGVMVSVEDEGPGVPGTLREAVFEPFRRGDGAETTPGTGIGLSLVARMAGLHGGRAWVEDRPGGGAAFRVILLDGPRAGAGAPARTPIVA